MPNGLAELSDNVLEGRAGLRLRGRWGHIAVLLGGGHICAIEARAHGGLNPLWRPPWPTMDPERYREEEHSGVYGPPPDGRLLAGIAGHNLAFDYFGPPSAEETAAGLSTHGEASAVRWSVQRTFDYGVEYGATLPVAQIEFRRVLRIDPEDPVIYCEETAQNLSAADRPICWSEHVTVGPPFLECGATIVDMPATRAQMIDATYSSQMDVTPEAVFEWPHAPLPDGGALDLRTTPDGRYCRYTAQLLDPALEIAYTAIANPTKGLLLLYLFRRTDFPWVGNWEERFCRQNPPWGGETFCRGIEFSSTPFAIPRREVIQRGPLFGESTYRWLPGKCAQVVRFVTVMVTIPGDFGGVERVTLEAGAARIHERGRQRVLQVPLNGAFLEKEEPGAA